MILFRNQLSFHILVFVFTYIRVLWEGFPERVSMSGILNLSQKDDILNFKYRIPNSAVTGSVEVSVKLFPTSFSNLEQVIRF